MKGLLLKDLYMSKHYFKSYFFVVIIFLVVSASGAENMFFSIYPSMLAGIISVSLCSYDEMSKWNLYSGTLPYSKRQMVTAKYLIGVFFQVIVLILAAVSQIVRMNIEGSFSWNELGTLMSCLVIVSCISGALCLPWVFKFGVEKGRLVYFIQIGIICGLGVFFMSYCQDVLSKTMRYNNIIAIATAVAVIVYAISWFVSVLFYEKREIQ